jgi:Uncharacterized enzyme involved in biosynthesis of extracellular polysaccharides
MIVTVFRSRLMPNVREEYVTLVDRMVEIARAIPGYISHKGFFADDGERVTVVEFEHEDGMRAWRMHPEHRAARKRRARSTTPNIPCRYAPSCGNLDLNARSVHPPESCKGAQRVTAIKYAYLTSRSAIDQNTGHLMKNTVYNLPCR